MYIIFKVAQAELRNLFYSPIAWLLTVVFFVLCAFQFTAPLETFSRIQQIMQESNPKWEGFNSGMSWGVFASSYSEMVDKLYLFIPLLTMGIINREVQSGSIKLLYSSPIRTRDIVFGKYLALVVFNTILIFFVAIFLTTGYFSIQHAEWKWFLSAMLAIFLLANTYAAIGLFISSLTTYQIVAGIITFVVFFVLYAIQNLWQQYDFVRDLTWFLSLSGRTSNILGGLITTRELCYFLLIIALFLAFALIKLKSTQESKHWRVAFSRYLGCIVVVLTLGYLTSRPGFIGYLDITNTQQNTLNPATQEVLKEMDGSPLTVTLYTNLLGKAVRAGFPEHRNKYVWYFWESVIRFYPNIKLKYEYYYDAQDGDSAYLKYFNVKTLDEAAAKMAEFFDIRFSLFQKPAEMRKKISLKEENYGLVMQLEYKGRKEFLRTFSDTKVWPDENHISGSIRRLTRASVPKILLTTGHYERNPYKVGEREFANHTANIESRDALVNKGVNVDTVNLLQQDIPSTTDILVVADPRSALEPVEQQKILTWLEKGGDAIFYAETGKQQMLNPILQTLGVTVEDGTIVTPNQHEMPHYFAGIITDTGCNLADEPALYDYRTTSRMKYVVKHEAGAHLNYDTSKGFRIEPILDADAMKNRWIEKGILVVDSAAPLFAPQEGDVKKDKYVTGIKLSRMVNGQEQRIIVTGDADFMSNKNTNGGPFYNAAYSWALNNEYPVYHNGIYAKDLFLTIGKQTGKMLKPIFVYIIPSVILLTGIILLIRRKRK
jgi:ABC-2 type transport system permease protein